jgi:hypothetical protein
MTRNRIAYVPEDEFFLIRNRSYTTNITTFKVMHSSIYLFIPVCKLFYLYIHLRVLTTN